MQLYVQPDILNLSFSILQPHFLRAIFSCKLKRLEDFFIKEFPAIQVLSEKNSIQEILKFNNSSYVAKRNKKNIHHL